MSVKARLSKINQVANAKSTREIFNNGNGTKVYHVDSARTGAPFQVKVKWLKNGVLQAHVQLYTFNTTEQVNLRGNHRVDFCSTTVAYQALGALKAAAAKAGKVLSVCENYTNARRLLRLGGELVKITNLSSGVVWGTIR